MPISYESVFQEWLSKSGASSEDLERHKIVAKKLSPGNVNIKDVLEFDPVVSLLTTFIIMHTPDFLDLDDPGRATETQTMLAGLLQR